jgi:hypothetical protein
MISFSRDSGRAIGSCWTGTKKAVTIKLVTLGGGRQVLRAVPWHERREERQLLAYVGERDVRLLV